MHLFESKTFQNYCGNLLYAWQHCYEEKKLYKFNKTYKDFEPYEKREFSEQFENAIPRKIKLYIIRPEPFSCNPSTTRRSMYSDELGHFSKSIGGKNWIKEVLMKVVEMRGNSNKIKDIF